MIKRIGGEKGFTLIEIVIVLFFSGILLVALFGLYDWHSKVYNYQQALVRVSTTNRQAVSTMQGYVSQAIQVLTSATINGTAYTTGSGTLVLQLPSVDSSNNAITGKYDNVAFYSSGKNFYMQLQPDASSSRVKTYKLLGDSLSSVTFTYNNATYSLVTEVSVSFQSSQKVNQQTVTSGLQQDMYLLNF